MLKKSKVKITKITNVNVYNHPLYSVGIEDDNSFISDGGVHTHNCFSNCACNLIMTLAKDITLINKINKRLGSSKKVFNEMKKRKLIPL